MFSVLYCLGYVHCTLYSLFSVHYMACKVCTIGSKCLMFVLSDVWNVWSWIVWHWSSLTFGFLIFYFLMFVSVWCLSSLKFDILAKFSYVRRNVKQMMRYSPDRLRKTLKPKIHPNAKKIFRCQLCPKTFRLKHSYVRHMDLKVHS